MAVVAIGSLRGTRFANAKYFYRADDLIVEENENVIKALKRLPSKEAYDRVYRLRRAFQCSTTHKLLAKSEWTKPEEVREPEPRCLYRTIPSQFTI